MKFTKDKICKTQTTMKRIFWKCLMLSIIFGSFYSICIHAKAGNSDFNASRETAAVDEACKGVVRIMAMNEDGKGGTGSGFGIGTVGKATDIFITNWHVVTDTETGELQDYVYILLDNQAVWSESGGLTCDKDHMVACKVLYAADYYPDFAILQAERKIEGRVALPLLPSEKAKRSQTVYALGYPGSSDKANGNSYFAALVEDVTVTVGTLSRFTEMNTAGDTWIIQHDAHINHGNSGGPLVTEEGAVIGINTYGFGEWEMEYSASVYIDYAIEKLKEMGIHYEIYKGGTSGNVRYIFIFCGIILLIAGAVLYIRKMNTPKASGSVSQNNISVLQKQPHIQTQPDAVVMPKSQGDNGLQLQGVSGVYKGRGFSINSHIRIGRDPSRNELVYPPKTKGISSVHCEITVRGGQVYLSDVGSSYGTYIKGARIPANQAIPVQAGDVFYLGQPQESFMVVKTKN